MLILVADDDPLYRGLLKQLLEDWGFSVVSAADGDEAWRLLDRQAAPQMAVLDWHMPGIDGFELCRRLRQRETCQGLYVLMLTGNSSREELLNVIVAGADDYLLKPFEPLDLKIRVRLAVRLINAEQPALDAGPANPATVARL